MEEVSGVTFEQAEEIIQLLNDLLQMLNSFFGYFQEVSPIILGVLVGLVAFKLFMEVATRW